MSLSSRVIRTEGSLMRNIDMFTQISTLGFATTEIKNSEDLELETLLFDPELLYVECQLCGKPIVWESGKTTELLLAASVDLSTLDNTCMIVSEGCPHCHPEAHGGFTLAVVRLAGITAEEAVYMLRPGGNA